MPDQRFDDPEQILSLEMCLHAISKDISDGALKYFKHSSHQCKTPTCITLKTVHALRLPVKPRVPCDSKESQALDGDIQVERFIAAFDKNGNERGFHAGDFVWTGHGFKITGRMSGLMNEGTHRAPAFKDCQQCGTKGVMEGRLSGVVTEARDPELKGCLVEAAYRLNFRPEADGPAGPVNGTLEGVIVRPCQT